MTRYRTPQPLLAPKVYLTFHTSLQITLMIAGLGLLVAYQASYSYCKKRVGEHNFFAPCCILARHACTVNNFSLL